MKIIKLTDAKTNLYKYHVNTENILFLESIPLYDTVQSNYTYTKIYFIHGNNLDVMETIGEIETKYNFKF